jgi:hypothetical protein
MNNLTKDRRIEELDVIPEHNSTIRNVDMYWKIVGLYKDKLSYFPINIIVS